MKIKAAEFIVSYLERKRIVDSKQHEIYIYGFSSLMNFTLSLFTIFIISLLLNCILECTIYAFLFSYIRRYSGGYHASTYLLCYLEYVSIFILSMYLEQILDFTVLGLISLISLLIVIPVEHPNNPLSLIEIKVYRKIAIKRLVLLILVSMLFSLIGLDIKNVICLVLTVTALLVFLQLIQNKRREHQGE